MVPFDEACALSGIAPGRYGVTLTEDWYQGRGVYGGLVGAILLAAMEGDARDLPPRTLHITFCAPAPAGPAEVSAYTVRTGRSVVQRRAELRAEGAIVASAMATFARGRRAILRHDTQKPRAMKPPHELAIADDSLFIPTFCQHLTFRQAYGPEPFRGSEIAELGGYCRFKAPTAPSARMVVALLDAWPPAALCLAKEWIAAATIDMTVHFLTEAPFGESGDAHYALEASSSHAAFGYANDHASLSTQDGTLLAQAEQLVAIFG